jgi:dTDP-4-dehydrorhamnose 3,5-epimerase-like enzyme
MITKHDIRGTLSALEFSDLKFIPRRIFYVNNVPKGVKRGNHAHYNTQQYLICLEGKIEVKLFDGVNETKHLLEKNQMLYVDNLIWDSQTYLTGNDTLLSLCSTQYDPSDYITNIEEFKKLKEFK